MKKISKYEFIENTNNKDIYNMYKKPSNELLEYLKNEKNRKNNTGMISPSFLGTLLTILIITGIILLVLLYRGV